MTLRAGLRGEANEILPFFARDGRGDRGRSSARDVFFFVTKCWACLPAVGVCTVSLQFHLGVCVLFYCDRLIPDVYVRYVIACVRYSSII